MDKENFIPRYKLEVATAKTAEDIEGMRLAGKLAAQTLEMITPYVVPGVSTGELDAICHEYITQELDAIPAPLNYKGFPKSICTSINDVICHGIPSATEVLHKGDLINIDVTVIKNGWHGDTSVTFLVGKCSPYVERLVAVTRECLYLGIEKAKAGNTLGDIGWAIQNHAKKNRYGIVKDYCGHGIGRVFHDEPQVNHYGKEGEGLELFEGMTFTIEPMLVIGTNQSRVMKDGWTVRTLDKKRSAQWEHTLMVTANGPEVFTARSDESF